MKAAIPMNKYRAEELLECLYNDTAEGISKNWQCRMIEALEYVIEHEKAEEIETYVVIAFSMWTKPQVYDNLTKEEAEMAEWELKQQQYAVKVMTTKEFINSESTNENLLCSKRI